MKSVSYYKISLDNVKSGDYNLALANIDYAIRLELSEQTVLSPIFCKYYNIRGLCKEKTGKYEEANSDYTHAIKLNEKVAKKHQEYLLTNFNISYGIDYIFRQKFTEADSLYKTRYTHSISYEVYIRRKLLFVQNWIEINIGNKTDLEQSLAISSVNSHVQVIARAGSGKTSTLVNRAIFLQKHCGIKPSEILLLAFNKKAIQEIRERLQKHLYSDIPYVINFHALAYALVRPDETLVYNETGGQQAQTHLIQSVINNYLRDSVSD